MPSNRFPLEFGKSPCLEITWDGGWFRVKENISIKYGQMNVGFFQNRSDLEQGQKLNLPDGALLKIKLISNQFEMFYNDLSIQEVVQAMTLRHYSYGLGIACFILGMWSFLDANPFFITAIEFGSGVGFLLCGFRAWKNSFLSSWSFLALYIIVVVTIGILIPLQENEAPNVAMIVSYLLGSFLFGIMFSNILKAKSRTTFWRVSNKN